MSPESSRKTYWVSNTSKNQWVYLDSPANGKLRLGVSLSGGGIRSASFSTGVIQRLIKDGIFEKIEHLAAISGGTYIAGGMSVTSGESDQQSLKGPPWQNGSDEEARLRLSTTFLSSGLKDLFWLISNVIYGFLLNYMPLGLSFFIFGRIYGLIVSSLLYGIEGAKQVDENLDKWLSTFSILMMMIVSACILLVAIRRFFDRAKLQAPGQISDGLAYFNYLFSILLIITIFLLFSPSIIVNAKQYVDAIIQSAGITKLGFSQGINSGVGALLLMIATAMIGFLLIGLATRYRRLRFLGVPASFAGPVILGIPFSVAAYTSIYHKTTLALQLPELIGAAVIVLVFGFFIHNRRYSLHLFYRERLQRSFVFRRDSTPNRSNGIVEALPYSKELPLSAYRSEELSKNGYHFPNVIYCAAVAANRAKAPYRRNAGSYTFESDWCGGPLVGYVKTRIMEKEYSRGGTALTIPSLMAISGAAVSPFMGRYGGSALRFMLAVLNLRLGVWIPHRKAMNLQNEKATEQKNTPDDADGTITEYHANPKSDSSGRSQSSLLSRVFEFVVRGWQEPGGLYVMYEALGITRTNDDYSFVSDGGHWENLGIVELLRRRCSHIIVVDASAAETDLNDELSRSVRLANSELGVEVQFEFETLSTSDSDLPALPYAIGVFTYPDGENGSIFFLRSTLWDTAPFELISLSRVDKPFPHHPTFNQYLSGEQFDGYRRLGWSAAGYINEQWHLPNNENTSNSDASII